LRLAVKPTRRCPSRRSGMGVEHVSSVTPPSARRTPRAALRKSERFFRRSTTIFPLGGTDNPHSRDARSRWAPDELPVRPKASCGRWRGGGSGLCAHRRSPCANGTHGGAFARVCSADKCASWVSRLPKTGGLAPDRREKSRGFRRWPQPCQRPEG